MAAIVLTIRYNGSLGPALVNTAPWTCAYASYPDRGGIAWSPQFNLDVLQPKNVDGARYRTAGTHFPVFKLLTITPTLDYMGAMLTARQMELSKGETVFIDNGVFQYECAVIDCRAVANAKRVLGWASTAPPGELDSPVGGGALGSIDTEWTLQVIPR